MVRYQVRCYPANHEVIYRRALLSRMPENPRRSTQHGPSRVGGDRGVYFRLDLLSFTALTYPLSAPSEGFLFSHERRRFSANTPNKSCIIILSSSHTIILYYTRLRRTYATYLILRRCLKDGSDCQHQLLTYA